MSETYYRDGDAVTRNTPVLVGGVDAGGLAQTLLVDSSGRPILASSTGVIYSGSTAVTPVSAFVNVAASQTNSSVVALTAAKVIRVLALVVQCGGTATTAVFQTSTAHAAISMTFQNAANGGVVLPFNPLGWFDTTSGDALEVTTGAGSTTGIQLVYAKV